MTAFEVLRTVVLVMCAVAMAAVIAGAWERRCMDRMMRKFLRERIEMDDLEVDVIRPNEEDEDDGE